MPYVDRALVMNTLSGFSPKESYGGHCGSMDLAIKSVELIPDADVRENRDGQWEEYCRPCLPAPFNRYEQAWKCTACGFDDGFPEYKFCPNCGAVMAHDDTR